MGNYKLSHTADDIDSKLSKIQDGGIGYTETWSITWDGNTDGRVTIESDGAVVAYHVSDKVLTADEIIGATVVLRNEETGESESYVIGKTDIEVVNGTVMSGFFASCPQPGEVYGTSIPKAGTYFMNGEGSIVESVSNESAHRIDKKYFPEGVLPVVEISTDVLYNGASLSDAENTALTEAYNKFMPCIIQTEEICMIAARDAHQFLANYGSTKYLFTWDKYEGVWDLTRT